MGWAPAIASSVQYPGFGVAAGLVTTPFADCDFLARDFCGVGCLVGALPGAMVPDGRGDDDGEPP